VSALEAAVPADCYVGLTPCGCIHHAVAITPDRAKEVRRAVLEMLRDELRVECITSAQARALPWACAQCFPGFDQLELLEIGS
jgi:hypothetical protein